MAILEPRPGFSTTAHFADLLRVLNFDFVNEYVSLIYWPPGDWKRTVVMSPGDAIAFLAKLYDNLEICYGVNPTAGPARKFQGRGGADDATRLSSLYADLDDLRVAPSIVTTLSGMLGERPGAIVSSGGGWHPYWPVDPADTLTNEQAKVLLARFGLLVEKVARYHKCAIDPVFDLARALRVPATLNHKYAPPAVVGYHPDTGGPLSVEQIESALDENGIEDIEPAVAGTFVAAASGWTAFELGSWAKRGIDREINGVEADGAGARNIMLNRRALRCFRLALLVGYSLDDVGAALFDSARVAGNRGSHRHTDTEIAATLRSARGKAHEAGPAHPPQGRTPQ